MEKVGAGFEAQALEKYSSEYIVGENSYTYSNEYDILVGLNFPASIQSGPFALEEYSETGAETYFDYEEQKYMTRALRPYSFTASFFDDIELFNAASEVLVPPVNIGVESEIIYISPKIIDPFKVNFSGAVFESESITLSFRAIENIDSIIIYYDSTIELEWAFRLRKSDESSTWFSDDLIIAGSTLESSDKYLGEINPFSTESVREILAFSTQGFWVATGYSYQGTNQTSDFAGLEFTTQYSRSQENDSKLITAFPELTQHISTLPNAAYIPNSRRS